MPRYNDNEAMILNSGQPHHSLHQMNSQLMHDPMLMNENISYPQQASGNHANVEGRGMMMGYQ